MRILWIESLSEQGVVIARQRFDQSEIRIGRGYDNDLLLDDPYVAAHHLLLTQNADGAWLATAGSTRNGIRVEGEEQPRTSCTLRSDAVIQLGNARLRFRAGDFAVPEELALDDGLSASAPAAGAAGVLRWLRSPWRAFAAASIALILLALLETWLAETTEPEFTHYLQPLTVIALALGVWATVWALLCRLFSGRARFALNLLVAACGFLVAWIVSLGVEFFDYALGLDGLAAAWGYLYWLLIAAVCFAHLRVIGPTRTRLKIAAVVGLAALMIGSQLLEKHEQETRNMKYPHLAALMPPKLRLAPAAPIASFFEDAQKIKPRLDEERKKPPPEGPPLFGPAGRGD
jgi:hypothetical protein